MPSLENTSSLQELDDLEGLEILLGRRRHGESRQASRTMRMVPAGSRGKPVPTIYHPIQSRIMVRKIGILFVTTKVLDGVAT